MLGRGLARICAIRSIDAIESECERGAWSLRDIPLESWADLADLLTENRADIRIRRKGFIAVMDDQLSELLPESEDMVSMEELNVMELWLQMLRIGSARHRKRLLKAVLNVIPTAEEGRTSALSRPWFLLLLRWARENNQTALVRKIFSGNGDFSNRKWWVHFGKAGVDGPETIDLDRVSGI